MVGPTKETNNDEEAKRLRKKLDELRAEPAVLRAFLNVLLGGTVVPDRSSETRWNWFNHSAATSAPIAMNLPSAWNFASAIERRNAHPRVKVLVIDEGFRDHDDLPFVNVCDSAESRHGNHVLGVIGARFDNGKGIDGDASHFVDMIACASNPIPPGTGLSSWFSAIIKVLDYELTRQRPQLVNVSLGYKWGQDLGKIPDSDGEIQAIVADQGSSIRGIIAQHPSVIFVSAAGNDSNELRGLNQTAKWTNPFNWAAMATRQEDPAGIPPQSNVIIVESVSSEGLQTSTSNAGMIAAPGENILSADLTNNDYRIFHGTSAATPAITAIVALMLAYNPELTVDRIRGILSVDVKPHRIPDAFAALASCRLQKEVALDLADRNGDGIVNREDLKEYSRELRQFRATAALEINTPSPGGTTNTHRFSRGDLNGDGRLSPNEKLDVPVLGTVSDLDIIRLVWSDPDIPGSDLEKLLDKELMTAESQAPSPVMASAAPQTAPSPPPR